MNKQVTKALNKLAFIYAEAHIKVNPLLHKRRGLVILAYQKQNKKHWKSMSKRTDLPKGGLTGQYFVNHNKPNFSEVEKALV